MFPFFKVILNLLSSCPRNSDKLQCKKQTKLIPELWLSKVAEQEDPAKASNSQPLYSVNVSFLLWFLGNDYAGYCSQRHIVTSPLPCTFALTFLLLLWKDWASRDREETSLRLIALRSSCESTLPVSLFIVVNPDIADSGLLSCTSVAPLLHLPWRLPGSCQCHPYWKPSPRRSHLQLGCPWPSDLEAS